jgi:hypothetical protein
MLDIVNHFAVFDSRDYVHEGYVSARFARVVFVYVPRLSRDALPVWTQYGKSIAIVRRRPRFTYFP